MNTASISPIGRAVDSRAADSRREQVAMAAREFEALFLLHMLKQMRQSMLEQAAGESGFGAQTLFETIDVELARHLAGQRGGLATLLAPALGKLDDAAATRAAMTASPAAAAVPAPGASPLQASAGTSAPMLTVLAGRVSSPFGWRMDPIVGSTRFHRGIDIAAAYGTEVPAASAGRVVFAGAQGGYGSTVVIEHEDGLRTRYGHLSQIDVAEGQAVRAGAVVGRVGRSGRATGPHLHFEVLDGSQPIDPQVLTDNIIPGSQATLRAADYVSGAVLGKDRR